MIFKKKKVLSRKYHDGDIVEFDFESNSLDITWHTVTLLGVVTGVLYESDLVRYKIQLRDNYRNIFGEIIVPEKHINGKIE